MIELSGVKDALLRQAVREGMFDKRVTSDDIRRLKSTGAVSQPKLPRAPRRHTPRLQALAHLALAEISIRTAVSRVSSVRRVIDKHGLAGIRGFEVTRFKRALKELYAEVAAADPALASEAIKVLRGEK